MKDAGSPPSPIALAASCAASSFACRRSWVCGDGMDVWGMGMRERQAADVIKVRALQCSAVPCPPTLRHRARFCCMSARTSHTLPATCASCS